MGDLTFAGALAVLNLVEDLTKLIARLRRMRDAPLQMENFENNSLIFCESMRMLHDITEQFQHRFGGGAEKYVTHVHGLVRQGEGILATSQRLLARLRGSRKEGTAKPWISWWQKVKWTLNEHPVKTLEARLMMAYASTNCFVTMLSTKMKLDRLEDPACTGQERDRLMQQISFLKRHLKSSLEVAEKFRTKLQQMEDDNPQLGRKEKRESDQIMRAMESLERTVIEVEHETHRRARSSTASTSQESSVMPYRSGDGGRDHNVRKLYGSETESEDESLIHVSRLPELPNLRAKIKTPVMEGPYILASEEEFRRRFPIEEPGPADYHDSSDDELSDSETDQEVELVDGSRVIDDGKTIRVEQGRWSSKVQQEQDRDDESDEDIAKTVQTGNLPRSVEVIPQGNFFVTESAELPETRNRGDSLVSEGPYSASGSKQRSVKGHQEPKSERHPINGQQAGWAAGAGVNISKGPRKGHSTVELRSASREVVSRRKTPPWSSTDTASMAHCENSGREEDQSLEEVQVTEASLVRNPGQREQSGVRLGASRNSTIEEKSLRETRGSDNDGGAVQMPEMRAETSLKIFGRRELSKRAESDDRASERYSRDNVRGSAVRRKAYSLHEEHQSVEKLDALPPKEIRDCSRKRSKFESRNKAEEETTNKEAPKLSLAEARDRIQSAKGNYRGRKGLRPVAEKRKRDGQGVVIGDPEEDDEFERKKRWGRGTWTGS